MAQEIQLDIFKEQAKDEITKKIATENEDYQKRKRSLDADIAATTERLRDNDLSWNDIQEYEKDLRDYERDMHDLEETHKKALSDLYAQQRS